MRKVLSLFPCLLLMAITVMIAAPTVAFAGEEVNWDFGKRIDVLEKKVAELEKRLTECQCQNNSRPVTAVQQHATGQVQSGQRIQYHYAAPIINQSVPYSDYPVYISSPYEGGGQYMGSCSGNSCGSASCGSAGYGFFGRRR